MSKIGAATLIEMAVVTPPLALAGGLVLAEPVGASPSTGDTCPLGFPTPGHGYTRASAIYSKSSIGDGGWQRDMGAEGMSMFFPNGGPTHHAKGSGAGSVGFVDQEMWFFTSPVRPLWIEAGMLQGGVTGLTGNHYTMFWAWKNSAGVLATHRFSSTFISPTSSKSWKAEIVNSGQSGSHYKYLVKLYSQPNLLGSAAPTFNAHATDNPLTNAFDLQVGTETTCLKTPSNEWYNFCVGTGSGCVNESGPNNATVGEKLYNSNSGTWGWPTAWLPPEFAPGSCTNCSAIGTTHFRHFNNMGTEQRWYPVVNGAGHLTNAETGQTT